MNAPIPSELNLEKFEQVIERKRERKKMMDEQNLTRKFLVPMTTGSMATTIMVTGSTAAMPMATGSKASIPMVTGSMYTNYTW